ncbi:MAG: GreA/GreB family elongation factor [Bacillota bacterium]|nr:GreA/GreB family elongation factor [Bacillota bacterium]
MLADRTTYCEMLLKHLVELDEQEATILEEYFIPDSREWKRMKALFQKYRLHIEQVIRTSLPTHPKVQPAMVTIGSTVTVEDIDTGEVLDLRIVPPSNLHVSANDVSYISPIGTALLLKRPGDTISVKVPMGTVTYRIMNVQL